MLEGLMMMHRNMFAGKPRDIVTVKSFIFVYTKFCGLTTMDMYMDTWIHGFQIIWNIANVNNYFIALLN